MIKEEKATLAVLILLVRDLSFSTIWTFVQICRGENSYPLERDMNILTERGLLNKEGGVEKDVQEIVLKNMDKFIPQ
ncbi:MAG: hypothetical protein Q8N55_03565 [bacterium]|nr:hypothetical protein [bacterium]